MYSLPVLTVIRDARFTPAKMTLISSREQPTGYDIRHVVFGLASYFDIETWMLVTDDLSIRVVPEADPLFDNLIPIVKMQSGYPRRACVYIGRQDQVSSTSSDEPAFGPGSARPPQNTQTIVASGPGSTA